jgi:hypothetical protein
VKKGKGDIGSDFYKHALRMAVAVVFMLFGMLPSMGQNLSVYTVQHISFGAFYQGATGGTVKVSAKGDRTVSGDVIPIQMGFAYFPAIFEIEAPPGTIVSVMNGGDAVLQGSNGGSMLLRIGETLPRTPLSTTVSAPARTVIAIGGTLEVGGNATTKPGVYSGTIAIVFNQE